MIDIDTIAITLDIIAVLVSGYILYRFTIKRKK